MPAGLDGGLIATEFAESLMASGDDPRLGAAGRQAARAWMLRWWRGCVASLGPASPVRAILDRGATPLIERLGYTLTMASGPQHRSSAWLSGWLTGPGVDGIPLIVGRWSESLQSLHAGAARHGSLPGTRWCLAFNGRYITLVDTQRAFARAHLAFDLDIVLEQDESFALLWAVLRREAFAASGSTAPFIEDLVARSRAHRLAVSDALHRGVLQALGHLVGALASAKRRRRRLPDDLEPLVEQALTVVYRVLFLLFAEARHLVPTWHPTYRDGYTIESLRRASAGSNSTVPGLWEALRAIGRLSDRGCRTPDLRVTAFDGRLLAGRVPAAPPGRLDDRDATAALVALTTSPAADSGVRPIAYADLGVEQLGAVYERVLEYRAWPRHPSAPPCGRGGTGGGVELRSTSGRRKASSSYYTPRSITDYLVRRSLQPLVHGRSAEAILTLRVLDPAAGSGAFLVSACRFLSAAYEHALVAEGRHAASDIDERDRAGFRRAVAQRCLFGVDLNPMAVQLARLSLWLTTLAADRPLTFLDHHLRVGDSLIGASPEDLARPPNPAGRSRSTRDRPSLPLFDEETLAASIDVARRRRLLIAAEPGDTLAAARAKQRTLDWLHGRSSPLDRWRRAVDLWCSAWFWPDGSPPPSGAFRELTDHVLSGRSSLPASMRDPWLARVRATAERHRFLHWPLEFPEAFYDSAGHPLPDPGFDAIVGNPPWNMIRADAGSAAEREASRTFSRSLVRFWRDSGVYRTRTSGQANAYQLFLDRSLSLLKPGGRIGMVLPAGLLIDHGSAALRRRLLLEHAIDAIVGFENRDAIFPIHRGVRFVVVTATSGRPTSTLSCRFRLRDPDALDDIRPANGSSVQASLPVRLSAGLIERLSGSQMVVPELESAADVAILERVHARHPRLGSIDGWGARFGRELNATEDRSVFVEPGAGLPVLEGKHIEPFHAHPGAARWAVPKAAARRRLGPDSWPPRARLAYRDVASAANRLTLIAALVPAGAVTSHTLFCLRSRLPVEVQWYLAGVLNSYVANYLIRPQIGTHVTVAAVERLPVPKTPPDAPVLGRVATLARRLARRPGSARRTTHAELQAVVARLYGLEVGEFRRVLQTLPLIARCERDEALAAFEPMVAGGRP